MTLSQDQTNELIQLYQSGKLDEAETMGRNLLKEYPEDIVCLNILGVVLDAKGKTEEALNIYDKAIQINDNSPETYFNKGARSNKTNALASRSTILLCRRQR